MKTGILIIGTLIIGVFHLGIEKFILGNGMMHQSHKNIIGLEGRTNLGQTEFKNGYWISERDSLTGIEIKNGKWIWFYKGRETQSSDIYDIEIQKDSLYKSTYNLILTNGYKTQKFTILENNDELLSLYVIRMKITMNYIPKK